MQSTHKICIFVIPINILAFMVIWHCINNPKVVFVSDKLHKDIVIVKYKKCRNERSKMSKQMNDILQKYHVLQCSRKTATNTGGWCPKSVKSYHKFSDTNFAQTLAKMFEGKSIGSFGDGPGDYKNLIMKSGHVTVYDAYDGAPNITNQTNGRVQFLDLTIPHYGFPIYDWVFSIEVAEHIPAQFEDIYLDNVFRHAKEGVVLSWATPGQRGLQHVNCRTEQYVVKKLKNNCFDLNVQNTTVLRNAAKSYYFWLKKNIMVFYRDIQRCPLDEKEA